MTIGEVKEKFLKFMEDRGHKIVPSASLLPENDPTTLFTSSGMQPLVPYLLGKEHPAGTRVTNSQRSFRSGDIEEVGDNRHTTYFEMLGNWSFGDYFKREQLAWFYEFLTKEIGIKVERLSVTCFAGDNKFDLPRDTESFEIWKSLGIAEENIHFYGGEKNWWSRGGAPDTTPIGDPCGPDSEVFYDFGIDLLLHERSEWKDEKCHPNCDCGRYMEIGNSVFMQYKKVAKEKFELLPRQNVDFGGGLERISTAAINNPDIFNLDIFEALKRRLEVASGKTYDDENYTRSFRIVMDHVRAAHALIEDGVIPSNTEQGYVLRRLIRRAIVHADKLGIPEQNLFKNDIASWEEVHFRKTMSRGLKEFDRVTEGKKEISGSRAFILNTTFGLPIDLIVERARERGMSVDIEEFERARGAHREISKQGSTQKFKGGLADASEMTIKYHTATHLLHKALKQVLGEHVNQKGSNITPERLRFDFSHDSKMTDEEKRKVEDIVNEQIDNSLPVKYEDIPYDEAKKKGAVGLFEGKYGDVVRVYQVGDGENIFSLELCGGPHVNNTSELAVSPSSSLGVKMRFRILKEEAVAMGIRRIKAMLE